MQNPMINVICPRSEKEDKIVRALTIDEQQAFTVYLLSKDVSHCKYKNIYLIQCIWACVLVKLLHFQCMILI